MITEPTLDVRPRILTDLSSTGQPVSPAVHIAGQPFWLDSAPSLSGPVDAGGLGNAFLQHGAAVLQHLDGVFAVVVRFGSDTYVGTDRFNVVPLYVGRAGGRTAISTDTDALARHLGLQDDLDLVTMAQALQLWNAPWRQPVRDLVSESSIGFGRLLTQALWLDERKKSSE